MNEEVERPALPLFDYFNSRFNIRGHQGVRPVPAGVTIDGHELTTHLDFRGLPVRPLVRRVADPRGEGFIIFGFSLEEIEAERRKLAEKRPDLKWEAVQEESITASIELPEPAAIELRRLAAKVAFEHFADRHGSSLALDSDFDEVRRFIYTGEQRELRCVVVTDRRLTEGALAFPVPSHAAHLLGHPSNALLGCFVVFYGLYHYAVLLSHKYPTVAPVDDLLFGYPDIRQYHRPRLRAVVYSVAFPWASLADLYRRDPIRVSQAAREIAREKLSAAL